MDAFLASTAGIVARGGIHMSIRRTLTIATMMVISHIIAMCPAIVPVGVVFLIVGRTLVGIKSALLLLVLLLLWLCVVPTTALVLIVATSISTATSTATSSASVASTLLLISLVWLILWCGWLIW